jgi:hypothetical protein
MLFLAAARYSGTTPSTTVTLAVPRMDSARAWSGVVASVDGQRDVGVSRQGCGAAG